MSRSRRALAFACLIVLAGCQAGKIGPAGTPTPGQTPGAGSGPEPSPGPGPVGGAAQPWMPGAGGLGGSFAGDLSNRHDATPPAALALCPPSSNPIDHAICARLAAAGCSFPALASPMELCRRIAVDLTGLIPSADDFNAKCAGKSPAEIVDAFMATPAFKLHEETHWAQHLRWNDAQIYGTYLVDADRILSSFALGQDGYDVFAKKIMAHPAFALGSRLPQSTADSTQDQVDKLPEVAQNALRAFLGRKASYGEDVELGNLWLPWSKTYFSTSTTAGIGGWYADLDPGRCMGALGTNACQGTAFGTTQSLNLPIGQVTRYDSFGGNVPAGLEAELEKPGAMIVGQPTFWEEAVDHALTRYTGWWKTTRAEPDTILPEVRDALVAAFRASPNHDYRALTKMIMTSILYVRSTAADPSAPTDLPIYCSGPLKPMTPEDYVSSMGVALARNVGRCDFHTDEDKGAMGFYPDNIRMDQPADPMLGTDFHYVAVQPLGGCRGGQPPAQQPGMGLVFGAVGVIQTLCQTPSLVAPADFNPADTSDAAIRKLVDFQFSAYLGRLPEDGERAAFNRTAAQCNADPMCGMAQLPNNLCGAILRSEAFLYF